MAQPATEALEPRVPREGVPTRRVLIVDDGPETVVLLRHHLEAEGYEVETAGTLADAVEIVQRGFEGVLLLDLMLPDGDGIDLFQTVREARGEHRVIVLSAHDTVEYVKQAIREGAFDFVAKSSHVVRDVLATTRNAFESLELSWRLRNMERGPGVPAALDPPIIAQSPAMARVFEQLEYISQTSRVAVLIKGESGTGKELVARAIHNLSARRRGPFVAINCAGIPETLLESELFGHERGAFTGAVGRKPGKFELAHGGTIFLDEIGEMPLPLQAKMLRALQEKEFERVGGTEKVRVDVRVLSATNRDLLAEVERGTFRQDLYYRIAVFTIELPPLRARSGDVPLLARFFAERFGRDEGASVPVISREAMEILEAYDYPGNVRELENIISHACVVCQGGVIEPYHLPPAVRRAGRLRLIRSQRDLDLGELIEQLIQSPHEIPNLRRLEAEMVRRALAVCEGRVGEAASRLGMSRATLYRRMRELDLR